MSRTFDYELFVIGGGSGGVRAARVWGSEGYRVAIAEDRHWGGTCVNLGCIPKKLLVYASHYSQNFEDARAFGWNLAGPELDWSRLIFNKNREIERLNGVYIGLLDKAGVTMFNGTATISGPNEVSVLGRAYSAERILIAVGGHPFVPDFPGSECVISSDDAFHLPEFPKSVVMVGGGYVALEFACIFRGLGARVDLVYRRDLFLRGFDEDLRRALAREMQKQGIGLHFNEDVARITEQGRNRKVLLKSGAELEAEQVFYATGRAPRIEGLWPDGIHIDTATNGAIRVDRNFQTAVPSIYALGDVVGNMALTPVAIAEAMALLGHFRTGEDLDFSYENIPAAVFTSPNIATVGLTEQQAVDRGLDYSVYETSFRHLRHSLTDRDERIYIKMIVDDPSDRVLGVHLMGPDAGEVIQSVAVAIKAGATKSVFDQTIGIHPTMAEELVTLREPGP